MRVRTGVWAIALFMFPPFAFAQQTNQFPNLPDSVVGPQLVAWSNLQKPQPAPQPLPPPERADQSQPDNSQAQTAQPSGQSQPLSQAFIGTIVKGADRYILKVSEGVSYQIDDQEKARAYEGKHVKVNGSLDVKANLLRIVSIEVLL
jgi:hypothetical protein